MRSLFHVQPHDMIGVEHVSEGDMLEVGETDTIIDRLAYVVRIGADHAVLFAAHVPASAFILGRVVVVHARFTAVPS